MPTVIKGVDARLFSVFVQGASARQNDAGSALSAPHPANTRERQAWQAGWSAWDDALARFGAPDWPVNAREG